MSAAKRGHLLAAALVLVAFCVRGEPPPGTYVTLNGVKLWYAEYGSGEPLLLLHGGLGHSGAWHKQVPQFARHFRVITLDSRGHGRSGFDDTPIGYALMARDVLALLDHLGIAAAHVVGWSDGGNIGLELAIHHSQRVRRIVAFGANFHPDGVRKDIGENARFNAFIADAAEQYQVLSPAPQRWQEFLDNIGHMWATQPDYSAADLGSITSPVLVLGGSTEEAIYVEHIERTAALIPGARLVVMPGTGHFALWEQPEAFNRIVLDFLQ